jgi:hypothetical protein
MRHLPRSGSGENTLSGNSYRMQGVNGVKRRQKAAKTMDLGMKEGDSETGEGFWRGIR